MTDQAADTAHPVAQTSRDEIRNDPTVSSTVKGAMEHFWKLSDKYDAERSVAEALEARQRVVIEWGERCFGVEHMRDKIVRAARFFEEAAELVQAIGLPRDHAMRAFDHVYSRDPGEPAQEVGGVANTLMALCGTVGLSFDACQTAEIDRCLAKDPSHFAKRNETKLRDVDALTAERSVAQVAWRWRPKGASRWIYDPEPEWLEEYKHVIEVQPLYTLPHEKPGRETESPHDAYERGKREERKRCHDIALAIDSGRGNEKLIAAAITAETEGNTP